MLKCLKYSALVFLVAICTIFVSYSMYECKQTKMHTINTLESAPYSDSEIREIAEFTGILKELMQCYAPNGFQQVPIGNQVIYRGETEIVVVLFDYSGSKLTSRLYTISPPKATFDTLSIGAHLSDVLVIDPEGEYLFLHTGRSDIPRVSTHYTTDNFLVTITYDIDGAITNIDIAAW